jgi:hypothetical protein
VQAAATYFRAPHREDGELVLDLSGLGFYRTTRRSGFTGGIYIHTPHGILSFGVAEPQAWLAELARLRAG